MNWSSLDELEALLTDAAHPTLEREDGRDAPPGVFTMIGHQRMRALRQCVETVLAEGVPGDLAELGVWRGGACIWMRAILHAHQVADRRVWAVDSFAGMPTPEPERYPHDRGAEVWQTDLFQVSLDQVRANFECFGLLDDQVGFVKGWFRDTLPTAPIERLALLRLDGDLYESTWLSLEHLYPKVSPGGYLIVDDYGAIHTTRLAVEDWWAKHGQPEFVYEDWTGIHWRKPA